MVGASDMESEAAVQGSVLRWPLGLPRYHMPSEQWCWYLRLVCMLFQCALPLAMLRCSCKAPMGASFARWRGGVICRTLFWVPQMTEPAPLATLRELRWLVAAGPGAHVGLMNDEAVLQAPFHVGM